MIELEGSHSNHRNKDKDIDGMNKNIVGGKQSPTNSEPEDAAGNVLSKGVLEHGMHLSGEANTNKDEGHPNSSGDLSGDLKETLDTIPIDEEGEKYAASLPFRSSARFASIKEDAAKDDVSSGKQSLCLSLPKEIHAAKEDNDKSIKFENKDDEEKVEQFVLNTRKGRRDFSRQTILPSDRTSMITEKETLVDDDNTENALTEDVYSFIYTSGYRSSAFIYAISIFFFQMSIIILTLTSLIDRTNSANPLNVPAGVTAEVTTAGALSMLLAVATQNDVIVSLIKLHHGHAKYDKAIKQIILYNPKTRSFKKINLSAGCFKWFLSCILQFIAGCGLLVILFILICQSDTIIEMMLNFAALNFISEIDDVGFYLCKRGFVTNRLQRAALHVTEYKIAISKRSNIFRRVLFLIIFAGLISGYIVVVHRQKSGNYLCDRVFVQFNGEFLPELAAFTGLYKLSIDRPMRKRSHLKYKSEAVPDEETAFFGYCESEKAWTFVYSTPNNTNPDPCDWVARSPDTDSFDLFTAAGVPWTVRDLRQKPREAILRTVYLFCTDCDPSFCGTSEGRGTCNENGLCDCEAGYFGVSCQLYEPCSTVAVDTRNAGFVGNHEFANDFEIGRNSNNTLHVSLVYRLPVYISDEYNGVRDIIMFIGSFWVLTCTPMLYDFHDPMNQLSLDSLLFYLTNDFHAHFSNYEIVFVSSEVKIDTDSAAITPVGLKWFFAEPKGTSVVSVQPPDETRQLETVLLCSVCDDETNPCFFGGQCSDVGTCECENNCRGALCQITPLGDGFCDVFFNIAEFDWDQGDCCEASCHSTSEHTCGQDEHAMANYDHCSEPQHLCGGLIETCWRPNSEMILGATDFAEFGSSVALSANGKVLAVGESGNDSVHIFEKSGAVWVQRGVTLRGDQVGSGFGASVDISGDGNTIVVGAPNFDLLANGGDGSKRGQISIYEWVRHRNVWTMVDQTDGANLKNGSLGSCIALSIDGKFLSVALPCDDSQLDSGVVLVWERSAGSYFSDDALKISNVDSNEAGALLQGRSLTMSDHGNIIAVGGAIISSGNTTENFVEVYRSKTKDLERVYERIGNIIPGCCGIVSKNGQVLAVSLQTIDDLQIVHVYDWDILSAKWNRRDSVLEGYPLDLSFDGSVIAVSTNSSTIRTHSWSRLRWKELGEEIHGGMDASVSLSDIGHAGIRALAVGLPHNSQEQNHQGVTETYHLLKSPLELFNCTAGSALLRLSITFDEFPNETTWKLNIGKNSTINDGPFDNHFQYETVVTEQCLQRDSCLQFTIHDENGICCENGIGGYTVSFDGDVVKTGGQFNRLESLQFGGRNC